ncbi:hypothetical protein P8843_07175 [Bacillus inaquosorum]|uniref:hypothetical protein n=1 Tax=Bacillus inaquosorum TaxID=483913 RepID=UPI0022802372|nr:hypothetical protein [Bacillus inaquosorum]MCY7977425.1 hypothetical protein [Bacillus inaquosorum]MEC0590010.1 hypothetical protein [Bacillus inaquosorum]
MMNEINNFKILEDNKPLAHTGKDITVLYTVTGDINGDKFKAEGRATWPKFGVFDGFIEFEKRSFSYVPFISGGSIFSICCGNFAMESEGAPNMLSLTGGNYEGYRSYVIQNTKQDVVGSLISTLKMRRLGDELFKANVNLSGIYKGSTKFVAMSSYQILMRQLSLGRIGGRYKQIITTFDNQPYTINASTEYVYNSSKVLQNDVILDINYKHAINQLSPEGKNIFLLGSNSTTVHPYTKK